MFYKSVIFMLLFSQLGGISFKSNTSNSKKANYWFTHGPIVINVNETYSFETHTDADYGETDEVYSVSNPDHREIQPLYRSNSSGVDPMYAVNESSYRVFGEDCTSTQTILPVFSFYSSPNVNSNGTAYIGLEYDPHLPSNCTITSDTRYLKDTNGYLQLGSGANPRINEGLLLYRSSVTGNFNLWDGYVYLSDFRNNPSLRVNFQPNRYVQLAILYEIDNYDNGWLFKKHKYYHTLGIYCFYTTNC